MKHGVDQRKTRTDTHTGNAKRLGGYLVEAGLITPAQIEVALQDQHFTGMRFGEILVARGWVKEQTVEYLMQKIVVPERQAAAKETSPPMPGGATGMANRYQQRTKRDGTETQPSSAQNRGIGVAKTERKLAWGELPTPKAAPVGETLEEDDVQWVG
ncbi:hypothetical protein [Leptolyngbya sp. 'hensonii']|uniref:hypothetical protein n=1 Tax=Leptolyngbya sp. 'hensonii' TaxID=1922337 RepID=UPI00094F9487|nr:hypothetical protein [Leptolyngbya sp. 'hensonii']